MHSQVQRDLEASILVWVPKLGAQKSLKVQYNILGGGMSFANWSPSGLCPRPIRGHHSSPPPPNQKKTLLKLVSQKNLWIPHCNTCTQNKCL